MSGHKGARTYSRRDCAVFRKTDEAFGGLSNMAPGFPVRVNGVRVMTIEALYQASRFPHLPDVQRLIIDQHSPMTAKMVSKPHRKDSREDWDSVRVKVMRWCLRLKLSQHWSKFSQLLLSTGDRSIVEDSRKDDFWGAVPSGNDILVGLNVLGRLLMELREEIKAGNELRCVVPPAIPSFLLFGEPLQLIDFRADKSAPPVTEPTRESLDDLTLPLFDDVPAATPNPRPLETVTPEGRSSMLSGLKPYSDYKDSGSKWLGAVPSKWEVRNLRTLISKRVERNRADLPLLSVAREKGVFVRSLTDADENHNVIPEDLSNYKVARTGNLVINKMKAWQGSMGIAPCDGIVSPAYYVFDFRISNRAFGQKLLRSKPYVAHFAQASDGVRIGQWDLSISGMRQIPVLVPTEAEQAAIVRFLDHASGKIDGFIRTKRKLIRLLNEQKQAVIHRAVTGGLHLEAPLKPSSIPWLAAAPATWKWIPIKRLLSRMDYGTSERTTASGSIRILTMGNIQKGEVTVPQSGGLNYLPDSLLLQHHDLLFTRTNGNPDLVGKVGIFRGQGSDRVSFASYLVRLRVKPLYDPEWLHMVLNSAAFWPFARSHALVNLQTNLNSTRYGQFSVPVPPLVEQKEIVKWVGGESENLNTTIARTEREIALMQEYRTRLTADIVTGKLDVREAAAMLPDLPSPPAAEPMADETPEEIDAEEVEA